MIRKCILKLIFFNQVLDTGIQSIIERFDKLSEHNSLFSFLYNISIIEDENELLKHCKDLQLSLTSNNGLNTDINALELHQELISFKRCSRNEKSDPRKVSEYICKRKMVELFPNLVKALKILLTLPIIAASAERSFSKMKIMKNYLRSQICQLCLVGLATLSIEKDVSNKLGMEEIVADFAALKARKIKIIKKVKMLDLLLYRFLNFCKENSLF
ncbi:HAT, C-terminal dimerisation domain [Cinara cedri]|uniref:HAT, C-terminal dimerisation domain n=1 Tax=Cinara cedri TaxID=506608 RepID=A0A5E4N0X9_9HEMI|nr:HAT, C-terminal dimerisation domain [Cinara cedri]